MANDFEILMSGQHFKKIYEMKSEELMRRYGLRKVEIDILHFLSHCGECDTAKDIAMLHYVSKAHVSSAIDHLTKMHYVKAKEDERDRRCVHLALTEEAKPIIEEILAVKRRVAETLYRGITEEERAVMQRVAQKIEANINAELFGREQKQTPGEERGGRA